MLYDIYWVFKFPSSKSIFCSLPHLFHRSIDSAKFVNVIYRDCLQTFVPTLPSTHTLREFSYVDTEIHDKAWKKRQDGLVFSPSKEGMGFWSMVQVLAARASPGNLLERQIPTCLPTPTKAENMRLGPGNSDEHADAQLKTTTLSQPLALRLRGL